MVRDDNSTKKIKNSTFPRATFLVPKKLSGRFLIVLRLKRSKKSKN